MTRQWTYPNRVMAALMALAVVAAGLLATVPVRAAPSSTTASAPASTPQTFVPDYSGAPYNGTPISHGLGPTYGETWCANAAPGSSIANQQAAPLALIPYEAFGCLLAQFQSEAAANGVPHRMDYYVNTLTDAGRTQYAVVVNAMETPQQVEAYNNWVAYREKALTDPIAAQALLESYTNVKIPIFMENNIHGDEEEGGDSMMQAIRDLVTLPRGTSATVDNFLDHAILITIPSMNPDGRFLGQRANQNGFDMNRDWLVQSQPEVRANLRLQVEWLAPVMLATHGYVNPTLVDGLTKPHNPGLEYDVFAYWNQRRLDANQAALARIGQGITRPVNGPVSVTVPDKQSPITAAASSGTTATLTTNGPHGLAVGAAITVSGVGESGYNGSFTVASVPTTTSLTYTTSGSDLPASSGGIVTGPFTTLARGACSNGNVPAPATNICGTGTIAASPNGLSESGTTVTVTTTAVIAAAPVKVADTVLISGAADPGYNGGPFRVTSVGVPTATSFTYESPITGLAPSGGGTVTVQTGPNQAEGWDDLGPFYTQTYGAFWGVDGSTMEMCSSCSAPFTGRLGSKTAQYVGFWGAAEFWITNRDQILKDQVKIFVRGVTDAPRPNCCDDPLVASRGFTEAEHDWMIEYPKAYIIPKGTLQRSDAEANRLAQWVLDNGITLRRATADFTWDGKTYPAGSYVVLMNQPLRGLALTALGPGVDYSTRISQLYAPPGGWSHGLMWGADTVEVPRGASFSPATTVITSVDPLTGGGVVAGASDWYSVTTHGVRDQQAILDLLRDGVYGEIADEPFTSTSGGPTPAGALIFPNDPNTVAALDAAGQAAGLRFERNVGVTKPATTRLSEAPKVGILLNSANPAINDSIYSLTRIFGTDASTVSVLAGANSIQNAPTDPLLGVDVLYNTGQTFPAAGYTITATGASSSGTTATITTTANHNLTVGATVMVSGVPEGGYNGTFVVTAIVSNTKFSYTTAVSDMAASGGGTVSTQTRARLNAFFARGGGYIATSQSANNLTFMTGAVPPLVGGSFTQTSISAGSFGGTAKWSNVGGSASPLTSAFPSIDYLYLPSNVTYFSAIPTGAVTDGQYLADMGSSANPRGPTEGYVAGLWLNRNSAASLGANNAAVVIHGNTTAGSRYTGLGTNPFSRSDFERIWGWAVQSTLWGDLTDEALLDQTITADTIPDTTYGNPDFEFNATASSGRSVAVSASGQCTVSSPWAPTTVHITAAGSCTITASQPGDANYNPAPNVERTFNIAPANASVTYTGDTLVFTPTEKNAPTSATVLLKTTVIDTALRSASPVAVNGDIRTATVTFAEGGATLCSGLAVGLTGSSLDTGSAECSVVLQAGAHTIDIKVGGNYTGTGQGQVTVIVAKGPGDTDINAGDGKFNLGASAGKYAGDAGSEAKFKVDGKIEPKGPKGKFELDYTVGATKYRIDMSELAVLGRARQAGGTKCDKPPSTDCSEAIYLRGTADLLDRTGKKPVTIGSGFTVQVAMTDKGKGKNDSIAVTVWDGSTLLFSSDWSGAQTLEQILTGGNLGQG